MKILLIAEQREGKFNKVSFETLAAAQQIVQHTKGSLTGLVIGKGVAPLADELAAQIPGTADRFDSQPFGNLRIELAVAVTRNQDFRPVLSRALDERGQEMLAVPKSQNDRTVAGSPFVDVRRLRHERGRLPDQP